MTYTAVFPSFIANHVLILFFVEDLNSLFFLIRLCQLHNKRGSRQLSFPAGQWIKDAVTASCSVENSNQFF
jgi:hypothetical protein